MKVYVVAVLGKVFVVFVEPAVALTLMPLILVFGNANQEIFAVVEVVIALTLVALGTGVNAFAAAPPTSKAAMTVKAAKRSFKEYLTSDE